MYKILISGYYGFNNIGDESILTAVVGSLREKLDNIDITVLSNNPKQTAEKYSIKAVDRRSVPAMLTAIRECDLVISGGGSLLQDVTSRKSILYYLFIMRMAHLFGKEFFIYSQGIGPIVSKYNAKLTAKTLRYASGIVVRDQSSKELLTRIGVAKEKVVVTADPVLRIKPADREIGRRILEESGFRNDDGALVVGFAIKEKRAESEFLDELCFSAEKLIRERNCRLLLIPFHYSEDMPAIEHIENYLASKGLADKVCAIKKKYLTDEMMSIIGNVDILVGVRLHAIIHAAIMGVPMIGISYDPKVNSFLGSIGMKAMCSIYDFRCEFFMEEFDKVCANRDKIVSTMRVRVQELIAKLDTNEDLIKAIIENGNGKRKGR